MDEIAATLAQLSARVEALEAENAELRASTRESAPSARTVSRRGLLRLGGAAAAAATGAVLLRPATAGATPVDALMLGEANDGGAASTSLTSTTTDGTLELFNSGAGLAFRAHTTDASSSVDGVQVDYAGQGRATWINAANTDSTSPALVATHDGSGEAIVGIITDSGSGASAMHGFVSGGGASVWGTTSGHGPALRGYATDAGYAVDAQIQNANNVKHAVRARTEGFGAGIDATSAKAEGGRFTGKTAQIRLMPSSDDTHPDFGYPGQLFVDKNNRLWFCKGSHVWKLLA